MFFLHMLHLFSTADLREVPCTALVASKTRGCIRARVAARELDEVHWAIGFWGKPNTYNVCACCAMLSNFRIKAHG